MRSLQITDINPEDVSITVDSGETLVVSNALSLSRGLKINVTGATDNRHQRRKRERAERRFTHARKRYEADPTERNAALATRHSRRIGGAAT